MHSGIEPEVLLRRGGDEGAALKVVNWNGASGTGTQVSVACHNSAGVPADSLFVLVYSSMDFTSC